MSYRDAHKKYLNPYMRCGREDIEDWEEQMETDLEAERITFEQILTHEKWRYATAVNVEEKDNNATEQNFSSLPPPVVLSGRTIATVSSASRHVGFELGAVESDLLNGINGDNHQNWSDQETGQVPGSGLTVQQEVTHTCWIQRLKSKSIGHTAARNPAEAAAAPSANADLNS